MIAVERPLAFAGGLAFKRAGLAKRSKQIRQPRRLPDWKAAIRLSLPVFVIAMMLADDPVVVIPVDLLADRITGSAADNCADWAADDCAGNCTADKAGGPVVHGIGRRDECGGGKGHNSGRNKKLLHGLVLSR
jgi:hypothetical protein